VFQSTWKLIILVTRRIGPETIIRYVLVLVTLVSILKQASLCSLEVYVLSLDKEEELVNCLHSDLHCQH
jgi:hypothetical protein